MSGFKLGNISLGKSTKKYTRPLDFDNNTTMDFGFVQPLFCQLLLPDSDVSVSAKQLVRLAPMPCPSFARVSLVTKYVFVPWSDLCGYYEAMLSNMAYKGNFVPTTLPYCCNAAFMRYLLGSNLGTMVAVYKDHGSQGDYYMKVTEKSEIDTALQDLSEDFQERLREIGFTDTASFAYFNGYSGVSGSEKAYDIDINGADFVYKLEKYIFAFRFSTSAKHVRSILLGLGYNLGFDDTSEVCILPVYAFCKAWFDTYSPSRTEAWTNTLIYNRLLDISDNYSYDIWYHEEDVWRETFDFLANCYYSQDDDFVSIHRSTIENVHANGLTYVNYNGSSSSVLDSSNSSQPTVSGNRLSLIGLDVVKRLTKFVAKDSIVGQKMSDWVRLHFNAQIANSLYEDVYQLGTSVLPLDINDVFSTSDTLSEDGGETLGAYAGKGLGFGNSGCKFHASKHGYLIAFASIVPKTGYFQGNDTSLFGLDRFTLPSADFDALGYEVTPCSFIMCDNGFAKSDNKDVLPYTSGFGYVPRFSGFKVKKNIVNGDMSRRGTIDSMAPYYLDRILQTGDEVYTSTVLESGETVYSPLKSYTNMVPKASEQWRYPTKYSWLGDFNRIFYNDDVVHGTGHSRKTVELLNDNFIVQSVFNMKITDCLKPITMSYDTFDEDTDNAVVSVQPD